MPNYETISDGGTELVPRPDIENLIQKLNQQAKQQVKIAVKRWSPNLRQYIGAETGLKMGVDEKDVCSIPMKVVDGFPAPFAKLLPNDTHLLELLFLLPQFKLSLNGLSKFQQNYTQINEGGFQNATNCSYEELLSVEEFAETVVKNLESFNLLNKISSIQEDVLGAYFYECKIKSPPNLFDQSEVKINEKQRIEIYWMPIALTASLLEVSTESLAVVVMAHELAHGFTHKGADHDGERWDTRAFLDASISIKEGLAQFYTACICIKLQERFPAAFDAYEKLLSRQSGAYRVHKNWADGHKAPKEVVRAATIKCRKLRITKYEEFEQLIMEEAKALS